MPRPDMYGRCSSALEPSLVMVDQGSEALGDTHTCRAIREEKKPIPTKSYLDDLDNLRSSRLSSSKVIGVEYIVYAWKL